jgi:two-component system chemotaxis sensor kinase CheA
VTDISGRGVGLDVVRDNVARLSGRIEFYSELGKGSEFYLSLPLTLAATQGLLVRAGEHTYCIPLTSVEEVLALSEGDFGIAHGCLAVQRRKQMVRFAPLHEILTGQKSSAATDTCHAVVLALSEKRMALGVEALLGQAEVVIKGLTPGSPPLPFVAGATILADGRLVTVLEPSAIVNAGTALSSSSLTERATRRRATVLVADDSITTRTMLSSLLDRAGYRVLSAADGEAAFATLRREKVDLVVSDVEMPNLDGFGLVHKIRALAETAHLPAILITSLGSAEDRARGAEAGANSYIVKKDFDPSVFLTMVADFTAESLPR